MQWWSLLALVDLFVINSPYFCPPGGEHAQSWSTSPESASGPTFAEHMRSSDSHSCLPVDETWPSEARGYPHMSQLLAPAVGTFLPRTTGVDAECRAKCVQHPYCVHRGECPLCVAMGRFEIKWVYPPCVATRDFLKMCRGVGIPPLCRDTGGAYNRGVQSSVSRHRGGYTYLASGIPPCVATHGGHTTEGV